MVIRELLARLVAAAVLAATPASLSARTIAITNAKVLTMDGNAPQVQATIVMRNGRIAAVGPAVDVPRDAEVMNAQGRIVTPGLMSAGTHLGLVEISGADDGSDQSVSSGPLGSAFDVQYALDANSLPVQQARADGVTRAMVFPSGSATPPFSGLGAVVRLTQGPTILERPRAGLFATSGAAAIAKVGGSRSAVWALLRNALTEAQTYHAGPRTGEPRDQLINRPDAEALQPVLARHIPLVIQAQREADIRQALALGQDFNIRIVILGGAEAWRVAPELAASKTPVIADPMAGLPMSYDEIGARPDNVALLHKAGVLVALSVPGAGIHLSHNVGSALREAAGSSVAHGLPYAEALKTITVNAAKIWGVDDRYGTVVPGRDADLVIWDGDPLEPSSAPAAVLVAGEPVSLVTRQIRLRDRYAPSQRNSPLPASYREGAEP